MTFLLDTNACIEFLNQRDSTIKRKLTATRREQTVLCSVVKAELYLGAYKSSRREENLALLQRFFHQFDSLAFDDRAAESYGQIRSRLSKTGKLIGPNDMMIAAIAIANNVILITHNTGEFGRVEGLQLQDWEVQE